MPSLGKLKTVLEKTIKERCHIKTIPPYSISVRSEIPIGGGMGSSAALSATFTAALLTFLKLRWDQNTLFEIALEGEKLFHGNPSGGDLAAVIYGGMIWFRKETDSIKAITPLPFKTKLNKFLLIDSGKPVESTKEMVEKVKQLGSKKTASIFDSQEQLTKELGTALAENNVKDLMFTIRSGERNLESLGVVGNQAKAIIKVVEKSGGAAKIMGGGGIREGSGMILCLIKDPDPPLKLARQNNWKVLKIKLEQEGLKRE